MNKKNSTSDYKQSPKHNMYTTLVSTIKSDLVGRITTAIITIVLTVFGGGYLWIRTTGSDLLDTVDSVKAHEEKINILQQQLGDIKSNTQRTNDKMDLVLQFMGLH
jgi:hypothetical protein